MSHTLKPIPSLNLAPWTSRRPDAGRPLSTTAADRRMIDAWAERYLPTEDAEIGRAERVAAATSMVHRALERETLATGTAVPLLAAPQA